VNQDEKDQVENLTNSTTEEQGAETSAQSESEHKWYVVHTYSGYEQKAKLALHERIKQQKMEKFFAEVLIPSENVIELVRGEKKTTSRKFFPGYMLVKMILNDSTWHLVKSTPKITGFVGNAINPPAVPEEEVAERGDALEQPSDLVVSAVGVVPIRLADDHPTRVPTALLCVLDEKLG
jgi:transcriptional antiterminator NusG